MNAIIDAAINRARTSLLVLAMIVTAGLAARFAIPIASQPDIQVPFFVVTLIHEGISPEDAERLLVMPTEIELRAVEGVKELTSYASEGAGTVMVEFEAEYDLDQALMDVREAVDRARPEMPSTAEEPIVQETSFVEYPILQVNLVGDTVPERLLYNLAIDLRDAIETVPSVLKAQIQGHREELLEAVIDPNELETYQISNEELISTIIRNNRLIPAGSIDTGEGRFAVKVPSVIEEARDIFDLDGQVFDPQLQIKFRGTNEDQEAAMTFVSFAFMMSLVLMFILLVTQFNNFYQSTLILFAVVLSTAGVLIGLLVMSAPFSVILTGVGVVALAGIVVNNNIVLIDTYNHLRKEHPDLDYISLIVRTGAQRFRPVMLTTVTTVFGLLPLAANLSVDLINRQIIYGGMMSSFWVPLSQAIVSGLTFATLLTLVCTPALLALPHQVHALTDRVRHRFEQRGKTVPV